MNTEQIWRNPHVVYRCFDDEGQLLYIGCTRDIAIRIYKHQHGRVGDELLSRLATLTIERHPDRASALKAEAKAIAAEQPLLNHHHKDDRKVIAKRAAYNVADVAKIIGIHPNTVRKMLRDGRLERIPNTGRAVRIAATEVESVFGVDLTERVAP